MTVVSKPLPLFRLPAIPLTMISRCMSLQEILLISLASKKSAHIMRSLLPLNWFRLNLSFHDRTEIILGASGPWARDPVRTKDQKDEDIFKLQVTQSSGDVSYQWAGRNLEELVKTLLTHFALVFNPSISIYFDKVDSGDFIMGVLNHVDHLNLVKTEIRLQPVSMSPENYIRILDMCKEVFKFWFGCEVTTNFEHRVGPDFRVGSLLVSAGHWMHLEDFVNCKKVTVFNIGKHKQLTYADPEVPRALIRKWIESDCRLECLNVYAETDFRKVLDGLEYRTIENSHDVEISRRCDGKKAIVKCHRGSFELKVIK